MASVVGRGHRTLPDVGVVVAVAASGRLTVRARSDRLHPEGTTVIAEPGSTAGEIVRVFGPVARPYYSVRLGRTPRPLEALALLGARVVATDRSRRSHG